MAVRPEEIDQVDDILAQSKKLAGEPPEFGSRFRGGKDPIWTVDWPISNADDVVEGGSLRINYVPASRKPFTIVLLRRECCISRLDMVDDKACHSNPFFAHRFGLPPLVCGPHFHRWGPNRSHVLSTGVWDLPCREPLQPQIKRFQQALAWFADQVNLTLGPEGRHFDLPRELV
jgi:hypothetical protein